MIGQLSGPYSIVLKKNSIFSIIIPLSYYARCDWSNLKLFLLLFRDLSPSILNFHSRQSLKLSCILNCVIKCVNDLTTISNWLFLLLTYVNLKLKFEAVPRDRNRSRIRQTHSRDIIIFSLRTVSYMYPWFFRLRASQFKARALRVCVINRREKTQFVTKDKPRTQLVRGL